MTENRVKLGPFVLLLTVITICLVVLSVLSFTTARADESLSKRHAQTVKTSHMLETEGQKYVMQVDEMLLQGTLPEELFDEQNGDVYVKSMERDGYRLDISFVIKDNKTEVQNWTVTKVWTEDKDLHQIWQGK